MSERKTAIQREREGKFLGAVGIAIAVFGVATDVGSAVVFGVLAALAGAAMWIAGMARS